MTLLEFIPWVLMAGSMALILITPLLSDGEPKLPDRRGALNRSE